MTSVHASTIPGLWLKQRLMGDLLPNRAKWTFGRDPRCSPERRLLSAGGSETRQRCYFVFILWRETEERPAYRPGQRWAVETTAPSFFKNTNTRQMEVSFSSLRSPDTFQIHSISQTINIAVIPVIILLLLDAPCAEKNVLFFILQDCKSLLIS